MNEGKATAYRVYWTVTGATGPGTEFMLDFPSNREAEECADDYRGTENVSQVRVEMVGGS